VDAVEVHRKDGLQADRRHGKNLPGWRFPSVVRPGVRGKVPHLLEPEPFPGLSLERAGRADPALGGTVNSRVRRAEKSLARKWEPARVAPMADSPAALRRDFPAVRQQRDEQGDRCHPPTCRALPEAWVGVLHRWPAWLPETRDGPVEGLAVHGVPGSSIHFLPQAALADQPQAWLLLWPGGGWEPV
jgi:hypothetical protein